MARSNQSNTLLVEIMVAVLFFALASTVLLEMFTAAQRQGAQAGRQSEALFEAQNVCERLYAAGDPEALLEEMGFVAISGSYIYEEDGYRLVVTLGEETAPAGTLQKAQVSAVHGEETLLSLPCVRYVPGEVTP